MFRFWQQENRFSYRFDVVLKFATLSIEHVYARTFNANAFDITFHIPFHPMYKKEVHYYYKMELVRDFKQIERDCMCVWGLTFNKIFVFIERNMHVNVKNEFSFSVLQIVNVYRIRRE